jgi:DNA-binding CsgD family transcriptional regulator
MPIPTWIPTQQISYPGGDLSEPQQLRGLQKQLMHYENQAALSGQGYCVFSLQPELILYTSEVFQKLTGVEVPHGEPLPLQCWLDKFPGFEPEGKSIVKPLLIDLLRQFMLKQQAQLVVDYARQTCDGLRRLEETILPFHLEQTEPRHLFWCWTRSIEFLNSRFAYTFSLVNQGKVLQQKVWAPPLSSHPLVQNLSPTEIKVLKQLFNEDSSRRIAETLNMGVETVKTHRRNIIQKTGYKSTDALVAVLRNDMKL